MAYAVSMIVALISTPAHATTTTVSCTTGNFTITAQNVAIDGGSCSGEAVIPDGVTTIGAGAFYGASLSTIAIPASVTTIGNSAFSESEITSVTFADSSTLVTIDAYAFFGTALTSVTIPSSVTTIGESAFSGSPISSFSVSQDNLVYASDSNGVLFNKSKSLLISYPVGKTSASYLVPSSVGSIGKSAFFEATSLSSVSIPEGVESIGPNSFQDATALTSINIPASVTSIGDLAFNGATSLINVSFLGTAPTVGGGAFGLVGFGARAHITLDNFSITGFPANGQLWNNLRINVLAGAISCSGGGTFIIDQLVAISADQSCAGVVTIPPGVIGIGTAAFTNKPQLTAVNIPDSVTSIGDRAFANSQSLASIAFPASVSSIGSLALAGTPTLFSISVDVNNPIYSSDDDVLFNKGKTSLIHYSLGKPQTSYSVPSGVTTIEDGAFTSASNLTSVIIPATVTSIGEEAFMGASALDSVNFAGTSTLVTIERRAFSNAVSLASITIPATVSSIGEFSFSGATSLLNVLFLGNAPTVGDSAFTNVGPGAKSVVTANATGFRASGETWNGLVIEVVAEPAGATPAGATPAGATPGPNAQGASLANTGPNLSFLTGFFGLSTILGILLLAQSHRLRRISR